MSEVTHSPADIFPPVLPITYAMSLFAHGRFEEALLQHQHPTPHSHPDKEFIAGCELVLGGVALFPLDVAVSIVWAPAWLALKAAQRTSSPSI